MRSPSASILLDHRTRRLPVSDEQDALVRKFTRYGQGLPVICAVTLSVFSERTGHCLVEFRRSKLCAYLRTKRGLPEGCSGPFPAGRVTAASGSSGKRTGQTHWS
jgi:hypothetical protein